MNLVFPSISSASTRLILLTIASGLLLAAGDASTINVDRYDSVLDENILAPMSSADANAASAALAATLPAGIAVAVSAPSFNITPDGAPPAVSLAKLSDLVSQVGATSDFDGDAEMRCLANAVYFESRGEPLEGQLAVAQAIRNRVTSGRYAPSICGVVAQPGQFTFDHSRTPAQGIDWRNALGIARIAAAEMWREIAPRAVSFHAARLSPGWRGKIRIAQIGNHIFYR